MSCASCGAENPAAARFCMSCGAGLPAACPACGQPNPPAARFCMQCGDPLTPPDRAVSHRTASATPPGAYTPRHLAEKILRSRASLEGERKQVTALFVDVVDSTPLAERVGPEATHSLFRHCFDLMLEAVHRYEGTVSLFTGDGILALFGAPIAHEDHPQRAVRAALAIQRALREYQWELLEERGIAFKVRIGINSGPVVVGTIGTDLNMTYTAIGDTVNLASRIQGLAAPGSVVISQATQRLVGGYFVTRDLGQHRVKGKEQAIGLFEVERPSRGRSRLDLYVEQGLSPLVGRRHELRMLEEAFAEARAGHGQVVFVEGEPGIGKSRLLHELKRRLEGESLTWLEGRCIAYGRDIAYLPITDLLKDSFGIEEADNDEEIVHKLEAGARAMGGEVLESLPFLKLLLSVDPGDPSAASMDPQMRKARIFETLRALAVAIGGIRPLVIVLEDLHWMDRLSEEWISYFADVVSRSRILLLLTYRSGYEQPFGDRPHTTHLRLARLSERDSSDLAEGMLSAERLPDELRQVISSKAEGNPFFVEEIVKSLLEVGALRRADDGQEGHVLSRQIEAIDVPGTVEDVIMARLDRLDEEPRRALQTAAVIGREFTVRLLDRTAESRGQLARYLRELKADELIYERSLYPELAYMFKHALTHEVAYNSLLLARRKVLHRLVGEAIEKLYADRLAEQYEILAHHYERAEAWDQALEYLVKSGEKALAAFAGQQAAAFYDRARVVLEKSGQPLSPDRAIALHRGRGQSLSVLNEKVQAVESFRAMLEAAREAGDAVEEGTALIELADACKGAHRFDEALEHAEQARRLALGIGNKVILAGSLVAIAGVYDVSSNPQTARPVTEEGLQAAREAGSPAYEGVALHELGLQHHWRGDYTEALRCFDEVVRLAHQHHLPMLVRPALWNQAMARCGGGDYEHALRLLAEAMELAARLGDPAHRCRALNTLGWVYHDLCNWELAVRHNAQGVVEARAMGDPEIYRNAELNLADCYLALGQLDDAQRLLETVEAESRLRSGWGEIWGKWRYSQHLHASLGELWLARRDPEQALGLADQCLTAAEATSSRRNIIKGRRLKGEAVLVQGKLDDAEAELEEALRIAREVGNPAQLWKTVAALAGLRRAQGREEEATAAYHEAIAVIERVAAGLSDPALRETLLASPQVSTLRDAVAPGRRRR